MINANNGASAPAGSAPIVPAINPNLPGAAAGQTNPQVGAAAAEVVPKAVYDQLEARFGAMGNELGEYRTFFKSINPLLEKLETNPELIAGITEGKITGELAKAVFEGRVQITDAQAVAQAAEAVQENPENQGKSGKEIEALIEKKAQELRAEFEKKTELQSFEQQTQKFIESTKDFADYADEIGKWLDTHDVTDIEIAYWAVKGQMSEQNARRAAESAAGERAKEVFGNAAGGNSPAQYASDAPNLVDRLIAGRPNPNSLGGMM